MCTDRMSIDEPSLNYEPTKEKHRCPYRGYADLHLHMFSNLAFGGATIHGETYSAGRGPNHALRQSYGTDLPIEGANGGVPRSPSCPAHFPDCGKYLYHGDNILIFDDPIGFGTGDKSGFVGAPTFGGWPRASSTTHQKVYYRWLERAYKGGLRLVSMLAVDNESLCRANRRLVGTDCSDTMSSIEAQIEAAHDFERWLDAKSGGAGRGWFRIVRSSQQALDAIAQNKLAVVLGVEESALFGCNSGECNAQDVEEQLDRWTEKGVRHFFPIHNFDNDFGGTALWNDIVNIGNLVSTNRFLEAEDCASEGYGFTLNNDVGLWLAKLIGFGNVELFPEYEQQATCNVRGLTRLGRRVVEKMMDRGLLIDIDHMSRRSLEDVLEIAERRNYPLLASHVTPAGTVGGDELNERMRTDVQLRRMSALGSVVSPKILQAKSAQVYGAVENDCDGSTTTLSMAYQYLSDRMGAPVALGSDFNGMSGHATPRFGPLACREQKDERSKQYITRKKLRYPFTVEGFGTFDRQHSGVKHFDYNYDGLAHVGLLPDMVADMEVVGTPEPYINEIFSSAQGFIDMWAKAEGSYLATPRAKCKSVTVEANARCEADPSVLAFDRDDPRISVSISNAGPYSLGKHTVVARVQDLCGDDGFTQCSAQVSVVDRRRPELSCQRMLRLECGGQPEKNLVDYLSASDNCDTSPSLACDAPTGLSKKVGDSLIECSARDSAGNRAACSTRVVVTDSIAPWILLPPSDLALVYESTGIHWVGAPIVSDDCDPDPKLESSHWCIEATPGFPAFNARTWTAMDYAGNQTVATHFFASRKCPGGQLSSFLTAGLSAGSSSDRSSPATMKSGS